MIKSVQINNFKSVVNLKLNLGSFNVLIGENGCGKSNILEAIAFGAAASADKLDHEFLGSRGIRVGNPNFIFSAFIPNENNKVAFIRFEEEEKKNFSIAVTVDKDNPKKWINLSKQIASSEVNKLSEILFLAEDENKKQEIVNELNMKMEDIKELNDVFIKIFPNKEIKKDFVSKFNSALISQITSNQKISDYVIYSPEETKLRQFENSNQIYPLGIRGEGLFQYLKDIGLNKKKSKLLREIKTSLNLLDWYDNFKIPQDLLKNEYSLKIKDKYLYKNLQYLDQASTNEGFLFLLFYFTLFVSDISPAFFAIDNIDSAMNPKLCSKLVRNLIELGKKHQKQVIVTTHNPAVLDGLNLKDDSQRLFVIRRNDLGHTIANRIEYKEERKMKLSEVWTKGFIGGLPENF